MKFKNFTLLDRPTRYDVCHRIRFSIDMSEFHNFELQHEIPAILNDGHSF